MLIAALEGEIAAYKKRAALSCRPLFYFEVISKRKSSQLFPLICGQISLRVVQYLPFVIQKLSRPTSAVLQKVRRV